MRAKVLVVLLCCALCVVCTAQEQLKVDFSQTNGSIQDGFVGYFADHEVQSSFTPQDFQAFGATVTVTPTWADDATPQAMQMIDRGGDDGSEAEDLLRDWIGTDTRQPGNPMTLTISGLPAGIYTWKSYHHDNQDQTGIFDATLNDAAGSVTTSDIDISDINGGISTLDAITYYTTEVMSDGINDITLVFNLTSSTDPVNNAFFLMNGFEITQEDSSLAMKPSPEYGSTDVLRETVLSWMPAMTAVEHDVYFGLDWADVNEATASSDVYFGRQDANSFDPGRLAFGQTYYWRVDEVLDTGEVSKGTIWSFVAEPYSVLMSGDDITATASSSSGENDPNKTIDGSGLDPNTLMHSVTDQTMWRSAIMDATPWLQYEFADVVQLDKMYVWNANSSQELLIGWGAKDVVIEYSDNGIDWEILPDVNQLSRAPGNDQYDTYDVIEFGMPVQFVRLSIQNNWGGLVQQCGLSEVQFYAIPVRARTPMPESGTMDVRPDAVLTWRAGRGADEHQVYIDTDPNAVAQGTVAPVISSDNSLDLSNLDIALGVTYYWRVDEVNDSEMTSVWSGPVWDFTVQADLVVDDFESYSNESPNRPFQTWLDGYGYSADDYFPVAYEGNGTGSGVGHDIWSMTSPHFDGSIMEEDVFNGGSQSMPIYYNNGSSSAISEATRQFDTPQDWTAYGVQGLLLSFYGDTANTDTQMYVKINSKRIDYQGGVTNIQQKPWQRWYIDLSDVTGVNLTQVTEMTIGFQGGQGVVLVDDILLTPMGRELITPAEPGSSDLVAHYAFDGDASDSTGVNPATVEGAPVYVAGQQGQAIQMDGLADYVLVEGDFVLPNYTVSMWFRSEDLTESADLLSLYDAGGGHGIIMELSDMGAIRYLHRFPFDTGGGNNIYSGPGFDDGAWYHLAVVKTDTTMTMYINGVSIGSVEDDTQFTSVPQFTMGVLKHDDLQRYFPGELDEVYLYSRALSPEEVAGMAGRTEAFDK